MEDTGIRSAREGAEATLPVVGWREWVGLPDLGVPWIKAKVDTGARTSALHAWHLERFRRAGRPMVRFVVHPMQRQVRTSVVCAAEVVDEREVRSSTGHATRRPVIETGLVLREQRVAIELTLAPRDAMGFRMLLGRQVLRRRFVVDPGRSYLGGVPRGLRRRKRTSKGER